MMRLFRHYISRSLVTLMLAESLHLFGSFYLGRAVYGLMSTEELLRPFNEIVSSAVVFTVILCLIMTALGLYERKFWNGKSDMLLRVGVSFMLGLFSMTAIYYLFPDLYLSRKAFSLTVVIAFVGVVSLRFIFFKVSSDARVNRRLLVLGVGQHLSLIHI